MKSAPTAQRCGDRVRIRVPINKQYKSIYTGKWSNPEDRNRANELGIRIYRDYQAGLLDASLESYRAMLDTGIHLAHSRESLIEALTSEYLAVPTNAKRNVLSRLKRYSQPITNERQANVFYQTILSSVKPSTAGVYLTALKQCSPLFAKIKRPRYQKSEVAPLTKEQLGNIFQALEDCLYRDLFYLLAYTGLRPSEALALRWDRVNLEEEYLIIDASLTSTRKLGPTKTRKTRRVSLGSKTVELLANLKQFNSSPDGLIFLNTLGKPISLIGLRTIWHNHLKKAGLPRIKLYKLRSTLLSFMLKEGYSLAETANHAGHSILTLTTYYAGQIGQVKMRDLF